MQKPPRNRKRERCRDKRILDVGTGKKSLKDGLIEEAIEESFDWLERGGARRVLNVLKVIGFLIATSIVLGLGCAFGL